MHLLETYRKLRPSQWVILFIFWTFMAVVISNQLYFNSIKNGLVPSWLTLFRDQLPIWYLWMLMSPAILYVVNRFPFEMDKWLMSALIYLGLGVLILLLISNVTLVYMFTIHGYIDLRNTTFNEYAPYLISRFTNDFLIYALVVMVTVIVRSYTLRKNSQLNLALMNLKNDQLENQLTQAQLQALKLQLNPHFLFNTLNTITSLTLIGENLVSIDVTSKLGEFLRRTLDFEDHQLVTLSKELEFFDLYLEIESVRFKDRLHLHREVDPSSLSCKVPNLILQPLIENAIKYGIAKSKKAGLVELKITRSDGVLTLELFNEGPFLSKVPASGNGVGLSNIRSRLKKLYPESHFFEIVDDIERKGVKIKIRLPIEQEMSL